MKRIIAIALLAVMLVGIFSGCKKDGAAGTATGDGYQVGFAREKIMPTTSVSLAGYGNYANRVNKGFLDELYASATAITDPQGNTLLIVAADIIRFTTALHETLSQQLSTELGIPAENIILNASHTHSGPENQSVSGGVGISQYLTVFQAGVLEAAKKSMEDRSPATLSVGAFDVDGLNFVKHVKFTDGTFGGDNFGDFTDKTIENYATEADHEMRMLKFTREGKKSILMCNWQGHPLMTGGINKTDLSADYPGSTRTYIEAQLKDTYFVFLQGCAGDMNVRSYIKDDQPTTDNKLFGQALGVQILQAQTVLKGVEAGTIKAKEIVFTGNINHTEDHLASVALPIANYFTQTGDREGGNAMCEPYGINSVYHARSIVNKAGMGATKTIKIYAYALGGVGIATTPMEYFNDLGEDVRDRSAFDFTLTLGYTNGYESYMPTEFAYTYNPYEANQCPFESGTGEKIADALVAALDEMAK